MRAEAKLSEVQHTAEAIFNEVNKIIIGKKDLINYLIISLLSEGNILMEGFPGVAKTTIAKTFASALGCDFKRIQFTPDIMPADITGTFIYNQKTGGFELRRGPVFTNIVLADEINRTSPKSQSALLECMEERQVTLEGTTLKVPRPFMVIATQNPIDLEGTYPLPEAQIDRFLFKLDVEYPGEEEELGILISKDKEIFSEIKKVTTPEQIMDMVTAVKKVYVDEKVMRYIRDLVIRTRKNRDLLIAASPRASVALLNTSKSFAAIQGRSYVIPDDVKYLAYAALKHRLVLAPESEFSGLTVDDIIQDVLNNVEVM
ncbi:MoxR-like ATPase [Candidatus Methanoperedens nitroreducens]|uniref:MoxR-like ATPase n=1 Tax=Candidatus Methanoperedens nitratireducens TaxID=1392998 RepID=A0A062V0Y8_9EURY|nr:MoxR family ATPase [Candidatus Methanoperedens nitroreducens]KCZ72806.1 MoxR-like ATPase [Candidatus Methanoperedens nitroreducens]MDJ1423264.1 MoxR family ATPase [Candidatus Methanoperedens sp.]